MTSPAGRTRTIGVAWVALIVDSILYAPAYAAFAMHPLFPFLGARRSWVLTAWLVYGLLLAALLVLIWARSAVTATGAETALGSFLPSRWVRRTGVAGTDRFLLLMFFGLAVWCRHSPFCFPWLALVTGLLLLTVLLVRPEPWPLHSTRDIPDVGPGPAFDPAEASDVRSWEWDCRFRPDLRGSVRLRLRPAVVQKRRSENPSPQGLPVDQAETIVRRLVEEGSKDFEVTEAARQLLAFARDQRFNYFEEAQNTLQFAQVIPYTDDVATKGMEYFRYPIETLADNGGDCDCKAILASAVFRLMGLRSVVLLSGAEQHAAVAVEGAPDFPGNRYLAHAGSKYYFCETTDGGFGFTVGEMPPGVNERDFETQVDIEPALMGRSPGDNAMRLSTGRVQTNEG